MLEYLDYKTDLQVLSQGFDGRTEWFAPRVGIIPPATAVLLMHKADLSGSDVFLGMYEMRSDDLGRTWSEPTAHASLGRSPYDGGRVEIVPCDMIPGYHPPSGKIIALGHTACYRPGENVPVSDNSEPLFGSYTVYDAEARAWSPWTYLVMPDMDNHFYWSGGGAAQWLSLPDGDILWPMYCMDRAGVGENFWRSCFFATVVRCRFDGETLRYVTHGNEMTVPEVRGLCEPSLTILDGRYYLTLRNDVRGYVTTSTDGLHYDEPIPWTFDDGTDLGSYNTQQHWVTHSSGLFLCYTRRGADNDHIFRHRAPLFMAQVDPERLCVLRETERVLIPNKGAQSGNFGAVTVSTGESWVTDAECMQGDAQDPYNIELTRQRGADNRVYLCRIIWDRPNLLV
jgi:hypothetical protein